MPRIPELAIFAVLQSIMFVLLFAFVFGGAIPLPGGGSYREFLMPGIFVQTLAFACVTTAIGDRRRHEQGPHRPLPLAADGPLRRARRPHRLRRRLQAAILVVLMVSGLVVGWRVHGSVGDFLLAASG